MSKKAKLITIAGPTASGKTSLSIELAKKYGGEIISCDSRQIYKEMNIGTAKPTKEEVGTVPHHLIDLLRPDEEMNAALYKEIAIEKINEVIKKGKLPFFVGGTGLYIKAVVENLNFPRVKPDIDLREKLSKKSEKELFDLYKKLDPEGSKKIQKENKRCLIRAIEVSELSGKPFSKIKGRVPNLYNNLYLAIKIERNILRERISKRVENMLNEGLEEEVIKLKEKYGFNISPMRTIGYQEWESYFNGEIDKKLLKEKIINHTYQFSRRQMKWFKKNKDIIWIKGYDEADKLVEKFVK